MRGESVGDSQLRKSCRPTCMMDRAWRIHLHRQQIDQANLKSHREQIHSCATESTARPLALPLVPKLQSKPIEEKRKTQKNKELKSILFPRLCQECIRKTLRLCLKT